MNNNKTFTQRVLPPWLDGVWGIVAVTSVLYTLVYMLWMYFHWGGEENVTLIGDLLNLPINLVVVFAAWRVFAQKDLEPRIRRMWLLLGMGCFSYFLGNLTWSYLENVLEVPPFPSIADLFYLLFIPLATIGLFLMPSAPINKRERQQYAIDMLIIIVTTIILMWYFVVQPTAMAYIGDPFTQIIAVAYPIMDIFIIFGIVGALLRNPDRDTQSVLWLIFFGMSFFVSADVVFGISGLAGTYGPGNPADYCWAIAFLFFLAAALRQVYRAPSDSSRSGFEKMLEGFAHSLPNIVAVFGAIATTSIVLTKYSLQTGWLGAGSLLVVVLVIARQFRQTRIQTRLTALILIVTIPLLVGVTTFISSRAGQAIEELTNTDLQENNEALATNVSLWLEQQTQTLQEMSKLPDIASMEAGRQRPTLQVIAMAHPNFFLVQTTDLTGMNIARSDDSELKDYHDRNWFLGAKAGATTTIEALISRTTGKPALNFSAPIRNSNGQIIGVASIVSQLDEISREVLQIENGHGITFIVDSNNRVVVHPDPTFTEEELRDLSAYPPVAALREGKTGLITFTDENGESWRAYVSTLENGWGVIAQQPEAELLASLTQFQRIAILLIMVGTAVMFVLAWLTIRQALQPINILTNTVSAMSAGDLNQVAEVKTQDEIGVLATTFNTMTSRLRETLENLEQRVAVRTRNLLLAAQVSRSITQVRELDAMLKDACELILKEFNLYYVQVYLTDPSQSTLKLEAGTGLVGTQLLQRGHSLPLDISSINGRAAVEKRPVVISDTAQSPTFRQNSLLPETRGEMAVPLIVANQVVGVLDMQSKTPGVLSEEVLPAFEALAGQLAVAIQNATLLAEADQARAQVEAQARRLVRTGWNEHLDAIHKPEQLGFIFEHNEVTRLTQENAQLPEDGQVVSVPIAVTGEPLGSLVVEIDEEIRSEQTNTLLDVVARQVAQQIENLRLLESAERYRSEAEQAAGRLTLEGWQEYIKSRATSQLGYLYDLNEVRPSQNNEQTNESVFTWPLKARNETIGKVSVDGLPPDDKDSPELVNIVAERLGAHIDSLRQYEQTQSALAQSEKLFEASHRLTQAADLQELVASSVMTLGIAEVNRALLTSFDYDSAGEIKQLTVTANWWNGEGTEVTPIGTHYPLEVIRVMPMFVSSTPVFFNDTFSDQRVDATTMGLVKKLNLRAVAVLPLHLGSRQIGALILEAEKPHNFTTDETRLFASLAPQIATILENRQQYEKAQHQAKREAMLNMINQKIQSATTVDAVLQIAARELGSALGAPLTIAQLGLKNRSNGN